MNMHKMNAHDPQRKSQHPLQQVSKGLSSIQLADQRKEALQAVKMKEIATNSKGVKKAGKMKAIIQDRHREKGTTPKSNASVQRKIFIENKPYAFEESTHRVHGIGVDNYQFTFVCANNSKAKDYSNDLWKRYYSSTDEFNKHISGSPVNVGLLKSMGLWYTLPFKTGTPFVLAENHATKVSPIMKESNRTGSILHESNGVIPIASKEMAKKGPGEGGAYAKTAMESVIAKTLFGVTFHTANKMKPQVKDYETQDSEEWIKNYTQADPLKTGKVDNRPYYINNDGKKVFQGSPGGEYSSVATLGRVKLQFDEEAERYIENGGNEKAKKVLKETKTYLNTWFNVMIGLSEKYKDESNNKKGIENLTSFSNELRPGIIKNLQLLFKTEYSNNDDNYLNDRMEGAKPVIKSRTLLEPMAMRDLAMLNVIKNTKNWGDHEIIAMGYSHVETQKKALTETGFTVITLEDFISRSKSAL